MTPRRWTDRYDEREPVGNWTDLAPRWLDVLMRGLARMLGMRSDRDWMRD